MKRFFYRSCIELTNHRLASILLKSFARSRLSKLFVQSFARTFRLNEEEMARPLAEYKHLHDLFIRTLKEGVRPIDNHPDVLISPVDGIVAEVSELKEETMFTVKGQRYSLSEMLGEKEAERYREGMVIILYLSPSHYHRIHCPIDSEVERQWTLGNRSYPVNHLGLRYGKRPLSRNYRVITELSHHGRSLALVKVGAMNVNTIELTHKEKKLNKGDEIGYFSFGSTVVLITEKGFLQKESIAPLGEIKMGERLALVLPTEGVV